MDIRPIASSSKGNAYLVGDGTDALLIDCGVPYARIAECEFSAVLITHSHDDHVSGLKPLLNKREVTIYANVATAEAICHGYGIPADRFCCFENDQTFELGAFSVTAFPVPHDTADPVGYLVRTQGETYFHATDIGSPLASIGEKLRMAAWATLESNHDPVLLSRSGRPRRLIDRIAGPRGHLSNDEACALVRDYASPALRRLFLAHLSQDCNAPHLAYGAMRRTLDDRGLSAVELEVISA